MQESQPNYSKAILVLIFLNLFFFNGCGNTQPTNQNTAKPPANSESEKTNRASDNIDELLNIVRLPEVPEEVVWQEQTNTNPKKIIAVLKFAPNTLPNFVARIEKNIQAETVDVGVENWFPEELTAQSELSGEGMLKGTAYAANEFYNIPYGEGRIVRIKGTDYFVLELTATN